ncbi:unnamed protein product [Pleuronectes platessa]|uniref:Uncharacterized protein n=1 Tax=Pleuronectes platessa TaxID=8262 RepID=A0A9N7TLZ5_PLEPL|nr:unnamed protein product [Pleuronectes platessa]
MTSRSSIEPEDIMAILTHSRRPCAALEFRNRQRQEKRGQVATVQTTSREEGWLPLITSSTTLPCLRLHCLRAGLTLMQGGVKDPPNYEGCIEVALDSHQRGMMTDGHSEANQVSCQQGYAETIEKDFHKKGQKDGM